MLRNLREVSRLYTFSLAFNAGMWWDWGRVGTGSPGDMVEEDMFKHKASNSM